MNRWAEVVIKKVQKDDKNRITKVLVAIDTVENIKGEVELTKNDVINLLKDNAMIRTIYKNEDGKWDKGAIVEYYQESNGIEYLKTKSNKTDKDNLDNLPTF